MKMIMLLLTFVLCTLGSTTVHAALNNENNPSMMCVPLGSLAADGVVLAGASAKALSVQSVRLLSAAGIAASNTDYAIIQVKKGATVVASLDTRAAGQGAVVANTAKAGVVVSAEKLIPADSAISVSYDETDSGTAVALSGAVLCITYAVK